MTPQPPPRPPPSSRPRQSAARSPAAPRERAPAGPVNASAAATPDPPPTVAAHRLEPQASASCHAPPQTSVIEVLRRPVEFTDRPVVAVENRPGQVAAGHVGGFEGVFDELGAHGAGDRPAGQPPAVAVQDGG